MTQQEQAQFALELLNAFSSIMIPVFFMGVLVGSFFFSRLLQYIDKITDKHKPESITFAYQSGTYTQELYRFEDKYYPIDDYKTLINLKKHNIKRV